MLIDVDELIVPRMANNLLDTIEHFQSISDDIGELNFRNSFFFRNWPDDSETLDIYPPRVSVRKMMRQKNFNPHKERSKFIVKPITAVETSVHFVWEFLHGYYRLNIDPEFGFSHHYRVERKNITAKLWNKTIANTQSIIDKTMFFRFKDELLNGVSLQLNGSIKHCNVNLTKYD